jgi:hypothetical protein
MTKRLLAVYLVAVILLALLVPSCTGGATGTIEVEATLCGVAWNGTVDYTLSMAGGTSPIDGTDVPDTFSVDAGNWTCTYDGGGPDGAFLVGIAPSETQEVSEGETVTFTLQFELDQDAWIEFITWTVNNDPIGETELIVVPCQIIDIHFGQGVDGCQGYEVAINETSELLIHYDGYSEEPGGPPLEPPPVVWVYVVNDDCAVVKEPEPIEKVSQIPSFNGTPLEPPYDYYPLNFCQPVTLDVETSWVLEKEIDYVKSINFFGATIDPGMHECVLFDLAFIPPIPGCFHFTVVAKASVELLDDVDVDPWNNYTESTPLSLWVCVGMP